MNCNKIGCRYWDRIQLAQYAFHIGNEAENLLTTWGMTGLSKTNSLPTFYDVVSSLVVQIIHTVRRSNKLGYKTIIFFQKVNLK
jgi:hypothetical protein